MRARAPRHALLTQPHVSYPTEISSHDTKKRKAPDEKKSEKQEEERKEPKTRILVKHKNSSSKPGEGSEV